MAYWIDTYMIADDKTNLIFKLVSPRQDIINCLLKNEHIDVNLPNCDDGKQTPIATALFATNPKGAMALLAHPEINADLNTIKNEDGLTPLQFATRNRNVDMVNLLQKIQSTQVTVQQHKPNQNKKTI